MPLYTFTNDSTGEYRDVIFGMNDVKNYTGENGDEVWRRVFCSPNMSIDANINPFSAKDFANKTANAKTYGEMWDLSKEMSDKRADKLGAPDPQRKEAEKKFYSPKKQ